MTTISESELALMVRSRALRRIHIVQTAEGRFRLSACLHHREEELQLVTLRKKPREWASLDRLAKHIRDRYGALPHMNLRLYTPMEGTHR